VSNCYLCGVSPAPHPLKLKVSFTAHNVAACPESDRLCDRCEYSINLRANYWNEAKGKYSLLFARTWSWLYQGAKLLSPVIEGEHDGFPVVKNLATRVEMRDWLLNPPDPPFTIAIAESGQKHILFLAKEGHSKEIFPVQFELDSVIIRREEFNQLLGAFEWLMGIGATKTEIITGEYKSAFLLTAIINPEFSDKEDIIARHRGKRLIDLASHVAQKPEIPISQVPPKKEEEKPISSSPQVGQLSLF